jgi:hypothetical protein
MKKMLLSLLLVPGLALAADDAKPPKPGKGGDKPKPNPAAAFKKIDTNADGCVSLEEFKASPRGQKNPDKAAKAFGKMDKDSDGKVTLEEFKAFTAESAEKHGKPGDPKPDAPKPDAPKPDASKPV